jgi:hypothetical protein
MVRYDPPKLYTRPDSEYLWLRWYSAGKLCRRSTGTADPIAAQEILEQHLAQHAADKAISNTRVSIRDGFATYERAGGLEGDKLRCFRRLLPLLIEVLEDHGIRTFRQFGKVPMHDILEWLENVEMLGNASVKGPDDHPVYRGRFNLTGEGVDQAYAFSAYAFGYLYNRTE